MLLRRNKCEVRQKRVCTSQQCKPFASKENSARFVQQAPNPKQALWLPYRAAFDKQQAGFMPPVKLAMPTDGLEMTRAHPKNRPAVVTHLRLKLERRVLNHLTTHVPRLGVPRELAADQSVGHHSYRPQVTRQTVPVNLQDLSGDRRHAAGDGR